MKTYLVKAEVVVPAIGPQQAEASVRTTLLMNKRYTVELIEAEELDE